MAQLLKGDTDSIRRENIRLLRAEGMSEADALKRLGESDEDELDTADDMSEESTDNSSDSSSDRDWIVFTKDFTGLGWAKKLMEEGESVVCATKYDEDEPKLNKAMKKVGKGWIEVVTVDQAMKLVKPNTYCLFSENYFVDEAEELREQGHKVFGTSRLTDRLEHDRQFGVEVAERCGLKSPETYEFNSREEGLAFLDENMEKAYVFKPDDGKFNFLTFVPIRKEDVDANRETYEYLKHMKQDPGTYILQERIAQEDALEVNCELWYYEGEPFLATMGLEVKRKNTYDIGEMCGCGGDFMQFIPLDCPLVKQTIMKMDEFYREEKYTGFADVNVIFTKDGTPHFLEVCDRFGYNAHPNMFFALALDGFGNIMADYIDGHVEGMRERFRTDIGCSLTLFLDHAREGLPVHLAEEFKEQFYPFDGEMEDDQLLLTGYSDEIGIFLDHGKDMQAAWDALTDKLVFKEAVSVPGIYYRWDLAEDNYYNAPILRYKKLKKRGLLK